MFKKFLSLTMAMIMVFGLCPALGGVFADSVAFADWGSLNGAFWGATQTDITLTGDCTVATNTTLTVASDKTMTFDLNGHILDGGGDRNTVLIANYGTLYIKNSNADSVGTITNALLEGAIYNSGTLFIGDNIVITGNSASGRGGGIFNETTGEVIIDGATVSNNTAGEEGGGIYNKGTMSIDGGFVINNIAQKDGGGICNIDGRLTVKNAIISGNKSSAQGGGIWNGTTGSSTSSAITDIIGCEISRNEAATNGGAVYSRNYASAASTTLNIYGGKIIDNIVNDQYGSGIINYNGYLNIDGTSPVIIRNNKTAAGVERNITIDSNNNFTVSKLSAGSSIGISLWQTNLSTFTTGSGITAEALSNCFYSDDTNIVINLAEKTTRAAVKCTVSFDVQGHGMAPASQTPNEGTLVTKPSDPTASGYTFGGWYKEAACTHAWDFEMDRVTTDTALYAKWTEVIYYYYEEPVVNTESEKTETKTEEKATEAAVSVSNYFDDVEDDAYYAEELAEAYEQGITDGVGDRKFAGKALLTKAQLATFLWRIAGKPSVSGETLMLDVKDGSWYDDAAQWAVYVGIMDKNEYNCFEPNDKITREEFAQILYSCAKSKGLGFKGTYSYNLDNPDAAQVSSGCSEAVQWVVENNIFYLDSKRYLMPQEYITRADALYSIMKLYELL